MKKVCLIVLLPWVMSCGWASSLFSSAPDENEEPTVTVVAAEEPAPAAAPLPAEGDTSAAAAVSESVSASTTASAETPVSAAASSVPVQNPVSAAEGAATVAGNGDAAVQTVSSGAVPAASAASVTPVPATAAAPTLGGATSVPVSSGTAVGGVYSVSPVAYAAGMTMADESRSRVERRRMKVEEFAHRIDSLVSSRNFLFLPNSMQEFPGGGLQMIYNVYFYLGVCGDHVEVHLPTTRGAFLPYVEILNFDTSEVTDYRCSPAQSGWNVSFGLANGETRYNVNLYVTTTTGETILTLYMNSATIRYVGYIRGGAPEA